ncbi:MAG TPA: hypothetical protein VG265_16575 [Gaiellaceae bacterium]|nr:hypothetical protein [Gaiellaceae bacterium]
MSRLRVSKGSKRVPRPARAPVERIADSSPIVSLDPAAGERTEPTCPECGAQVEWCYDEEAGYGEAWCAAGCGWEAVA